MSLRCPFCSSKRISQSQSSTAAIITCIGAVGGIATAILKTTRKTRAVTALAFTPITIASLLISGLSGGINGSKIGAQLGGKLNQSYQCKKCHKRFSRYPALN